MARTRASPSLGNYIRVAESAANIIAILRQTGVCRANLQKLEYIKYVRYRPLDIDAPAYGPFRKNDSYRDAIEGTTLPPPARGRNLHAQALNPRPGQSPRCSSSGIAPRVTDKQKRPPLGGSFDFCLLLLYLFRRLLAPSASCANRADRARRGWWRREEGRQATASRPECNHTLM
jgi:hypothetical protein